MQLLVCCKMGHVAYNIQGHVYPNLLLVSIFNPTELLRKNKALSTIPPPPHHHHKLNQLK